MKTTYNWIKEYCDAPLTAEELARKLSLSGCLIEEMHPLGGDTLYVAEVTSNRPDLLGTMGIAREAAALTGAPLVSPKVEFQTSGEDVHAVSSVEVPAPDLCPRYTARLIRGVKVGPSPDWLRARLESIGVRPVNNVVDVTNYVLFECGQPLHAFDFDKLAGGKIIVRRPNEGEKLIAIDGTECKLNPSMLIIADGENPVAIAGIMGGLATEISDRTANVLLESAQFENTNIRRTSRALGLASDASYRFERGVDPVQTEWASRRAARLIQEIAGGAILDGVIDVWAQPYEPKRVTLRYQRMSQLLGTLIAPDVARAILQRLGFAPVEEESDPNRVTVNIPPWRANDVTREADLIEEVIRIYGYDKIPETGTLPASVGRVSAFERVSAITREFLPGTGFFETITNTFCEEWAARLVSPWTDKESILVQNTIRRDENRLRVSLLPGLMAVKRTNAAHGVAKSPLFEISRIFTPRPPRTEGEPTRDDRLPIERHVLALLGEEDLLHLKGIIETLAEALGIARLRFEANALPFFSEKRSARIFLGDKFLGVFGEVSHETLARFDLVHAPVMAELDFDLLVECAQLERHFSKLPEYPGAERDLAVIVDESLPWARIEDTIRGLNIPILQRIQFFDVFRGKQIPAGRKSIAFSLAFRAPDRTLTSEEIEAARQACINALTGLGAQLRG